MSTSEIFPLTNARIVHSACRMNFHSIFTDANGNTFYGAWKPPKLPEKETDVFIQIPSFYAYRPDAISYEYYDTPLYGWAIVYANNIVNPLDRDEGLYPGRTIRIPDINTITSALLL